MSNKFATISGVHGYVPDYVLTNKELETMVDTNDEWIQSRTGIKERRILKKEGWAASDMGVEMVKGLLEKTNTKPEEVDMLICATITGDRVFPDTANTIADKIGAINSFGFDINAACSGFLYALTTGAKFVESGSHKKVIIVGLDMMSSIINYKDRSTCIIFGDGGGAVMLEPTEEITGVQDSVLKSDGSGREYLNMPAGGSLKPHTLETLAAGEQYVFQEGRPVFKAAVKGMSGAIKEVMERNDLENDDITWLVPHQANIRIITSVARQLDFPMEKVMMNIQKYGNTTAGTLPLCLWDYESKLKKGDKIVLAAFGGGFTWGATYLVWGY
ncbi:ketoacyl-ACP synthase III [bacterium]|jgi:3-oxoacyl-[acyl-carrier-protein] synthase-3|nr:ketoacyl-ACP synthase III [Saprospiraceae bacterium]MDC3253318.1 ketoacyl-ACP synthase III [bacterium]MDG1435502.1 ketoacyl-ACP synthase III [Saprospiraceae bacterium]